MKKLIDTPWGTAQHCNKIAEGIEFYDTAGHGGIKLSEERQSIVEKKFPNFEPFCGCRGWYEEDCDVAVVMVTFPEYFPKSVDTAIAAIKRDPGYFKIVF